jgi:hypothetical protein
MAQLAEGGERLLAAQMELRLDPRVGGAARRRARSAARDPAESERDD